MTRDGPGARTWQMFLGRRQPPVHSPLTSRAVRGALGQLLLRGADPRPAVADLLCREYRADRAYLCRSGTEALQLALRLGATVLQSAPTLALPAYTCFDVASAAVAVGYPVVLYDLDPGTLGPDAKSLDRALQAGARIAVVSPLYGIPVDWEDIESRAGPYGAILIEDAAQGHGAEWRGRPLGTQGQMSVLSFGRGKGWTGGGGGALLLRGLDVADATDALAHAHRPVDEVSVLLRVTAQWTLARPGAYAIPAAIPWLGLGETRYRKAKEPREMARAAAVALLRTRRASAAEAEVRRANAERLLIALSSRRHVRPVQPPPGGVPGYLRLPVRLCHGLNGFANAGEARRLGVAPAYPASLGDLPALRSRMASSVDDFPGARDLVERLVTLPTHSLLSITDRQRLLHLCDTYGQRGG